jgi:hypothetical protein
MNIPSFDRLRGDIGRTYLLAGPWEGQIQAQLNGVYEGVPMNRRYCCYSAELALPHGVQLPQSTCTVTAGHDSWPFLLLTPVGPSGDGRQLMQMVFHYMVPQAAAHEPAGA